jgi:ribokinase
MSKNLLVMGSFVADTAYRAARLPLWGETLMGSGFALGPGGKGSNQAVAAARALGSKAAVQFLSKLGDDAFGQLARTTWAAAGIDASLVGTCDTPTGAAAILIDEARGENAIIVVPGACFTLTPAEVDAASEAIRSASVFLTQLELPLDTVERGMEIARQAGVPTILNPAPAQPLPDSLLALADFLIPNESEAALLTGLPVADVTQAERAARSLLGRGARTVIVTLGEQGALLCMRNEPAILVPSFAAGAVVETTGAGDAFCGGFAAALHEGMPVRQAVRFGCATAGISVTRAGTAPSMPQRDEIDALLRMLER